jgi:hypothetical protein
MARSPFPTISLAELGLPGTLKGLLRALFQDEEGPRL